jgi:hypothetical protein
MENKCLNEIPIENHSKQACSQIIVEFLIKDAII